MLQSIETLQIERLQVVVLPYRSTTLNIPPERLETDNRAVICTASLSPRERRELLEAMQAVKMIERPQFEPDMRWAVRFIDPSANVASVLYLGLRYPTRTNYIVLEGRRAIVSDEVLGWLEKRFFPNAAPDPFFPPAGGCG